MDDTTNKGLFGEMADWFRKPFNTQGSALDWVLFVGLLFIALFFWQFTLLEITREV